MKQEYYKCEVCNKFFEIEKLKYHTPPDENNRAVIFCGPECSLEYHINNKLVGEQ